MGDINNDGLINIVDISYMVDIIVHNDSPGVSLYYSDFNYDGQTNIFDLLMIIDTLDNI